MHILSFDTTGQFGSVALIDEQANIVEKKTTDKMNHLKHLMDMTNTLMEESGVSKGDIVAIACSIGPGSFTGIRIGVSSARAMAQALSLPCISVPTLDSFRVYSLNRGAKNCTTFSNLNNTATCVILNARRHQVYGAIFQNHTVVDDNLNLRLLSSEHDILPPKQYMIDDIISTLNNSDIDSVHFYGDGIDAYEDIIVKNIQKQFAFAPSSERYQKASLAAIYALTKWEAGDTTSHFNLLPDYMRETEAETNLKSGELDKRKKKKAEELDKHLEKIRKLRESHEKQT